MISTSRKPAINSPRHLVLRHSRRLLDKINRDPELGDDPIPHLDAGDEQIFSFYAPALEAGTYGVDVRQNISATGPDGNLQKLPLKSIQNFTVVAPRFTLPDGSIHSTYPSQGHGDKIETLPHVVLNDAHLPWERVASTKVEPDAARNRVPWLAVLVFTPEELKLPAAAIDGPNNIFQHTQNLAKPVKQNATLAINMTISDIWATDNTITPIPNSTDPAVSSASTDVIFLQPSLFTALFTTYDTTGTPVKDQRSADVSRYKFLAHVREINTEGMAESGVGDGTGLFSIVVSHRVGPLNITQPTTVVVHLVSIEDVESMALPLAASTQFVALSSLYSWTYICLPPSSMNVFDTFQGIGNSVSVLRAPQNIIDQAAKSPGPVGPRVVQRLMDGYSMTKYRTETGELTVSLTHGPFTPTTVKYPLPNWNSSSNFGTDLQILDQQVGLMDITYSAAWQLGKTLAMADQSFTAALSRLRTQIYSKAMNKAKTEILRPLGGYKTREETLQTLGTSMDTLRGLRHSDLLVHGPVQNRWQREPPAEVLDLSYRGPLIAPIFARHAADAVRELASSTDGGGKQRYDEMNTPYSTDWMIVLKWVLDRMYLVNVPAHYLITDPSHLPPESIRFFTIDANWVDALIDGALSLANHADDDVDAGRIAIKTAINEYLNNTLHKLKTKPQIPTYGFLLRSDLVTQFPDLVVQTSPTDPAAAPILRHENIDKGVMLVLLDRAPGKDFDTLTLQQPPHQQSFVVGVEVSEKLLKTSYKRVYTVEKPEDPNRADELSEGLWNPGAATPPPVFLWGANNEIRTLLFPAWAEDVFKTITAGINAVKQGYFVDTFPSATLCGIQLNNPIWRLRILLTETKVPEELGGGERVTRMLVSPEEAEVVAAAVAETKAPQQKQPSLPPPDQRKRLTPFHPLQPPHYPPYRLPPKVRRPPPIGGGPASPPVFAYSVYALGAKSLNVPTLTGLPLDLVFSIILQSNPADDFDLLSVTLTVPIGPMGGFPRTLLNTYSGPGATMLSNLRFNVSIGFSGGVMTLGLFPRTAGKSVHINCATELSFILSMVNVNPWNFQDPVPVEIDVVEDYVTPGPQSKSFFVQLVPEDVIG